MFNRTQYRMIKRKYFTISAILILNISIAKPAFSEEKNSLKQFADDYAQKTIANKNIWKTYKSKFGWSIKYPDDWKVAAVGEDSEVSEAVGISLTGPNNCYSRGVPCGYIFFNNMHMPGGCCYKSESILKRNAKESIQLSIKSEKLSKTNKKVELVEEGEVTYGGWRGYHAVLFILENIEEGNPVYRRQIQIRSDDKTLLISIDEQNKTKIYEKLEEVKYIKLYEEILSTLQFQKK